MIARIWHGRVPLEKAAEYERYVFDTGIRAYRATPGNLGAWLLRRNEDDVAHFTTLSFWESIHAIITFAGPDYEVARYFPRDDDYLLEREPKVVHYDVVGPHPSAGDT